MLQAERARALRVGRLGRLRLRRGYYVYVGSALGPGGLRARLAHHARRAARPHWHIDHLRRGARPLEAWYACGLERREHEWARRMGGLRGAAVPAHRFGASDCRCASHLVFFARPPSVRAFRAALARSGGSVAVRVWRAGAG